MTNPSEAATKGGGHTPGPWAVETPMGDNCPWIVQADKEAYEWEPIATLGDCLEDGPSPRSKAFARIHADARLIAAAPDLLEALEDLAAVVSMLNVLAGSKGKELLERAHETITRARTVQP